MRILLFICVLTFVVSLVGCEGQTPFSEPKVVSVPLRDIAADRLSYRYEADVPAPPVDKMPPIPKFERDDKVQNDFDTNRPLEILDRTIASPDGSRVVAVYRKPEDLISDFRLDMYSKEGKLLKKVTHEEMAAQFPDTIVWAPDGTNVAFVAKIRGQSKDGTSTEGEQENKEEEKPEVVQRDGEEPEKVEEPTPDETKDGDPSTEANKQVLTFRTEQLYVTDSNAAEVRPLTKVEGLIYFYFVWAPDSSALAALAAIHTEWAFFESRAKEAGQVFIPRGRPRLVEKNGRERRLDDMLTAVHPVWAPDSSKVAVAFDKQVRVYDGVRNRPTQAAIPLEADMLASAKEFDKTLSSSDSEGEESEDGEKPEPKPTSTPDPNQPTNFQPVSYNPIVNMVWTEDKMLYLETGFVRNYLDEAENVRSYMRWHRLILSAQAVPLSPSGQ